MDLLKKNKNNKKLKNQKRFKKNLQNCLMKWMFLKNLKKNKLQKKNWKQKKEKIQLINQLLKCFKRQKKMIFLQRWNNNHNHRLKKKKNKKKNKLIFLKFLKMNKFLNLMKFQWRNMNNYGKILIIKMNKI